MIHIRFFASLRERLQSSEIDIAFQQQASIKALVDELVKLDARFALLKEQDDLVAVNQTLSAPEHIVNDNDEVAFFPPVTGG